MKKKLKILLIIFLLFVVVRPALGASETGEIIAGEEINGEINLDTNSLVNKTDLNTGNLEITNTNNTARALVLEIIKERVAVDVSGYEVRQQDVRLKILSGSLAGQKVEYHGISDVLFNNINIYRLGDKVFIYYSPEEDGKNVYYITDFVRSNSLIWLLLAFIVVIFMVGKNKGLRAIASLGLTFLFVTKVMAPLMLSGYNPLLVGLIGSFIILLLIVYLTEGFNRKSHVAVISILFSLIVTAMLAVIFAHLSRLTGLSDDEVAYLINAGKALNFKDLLLAAIIIGTLGIMDDIVVGQVEAVQQIKEADQKLKSADVYRRAMKVGRSHLGSVINTLFLAYAGAALPLLLLINLQQVPFVSFADVVNSEQIASEIVRTLVGIIGLALALPISTWLASIFLRVKNKNN